MERMQQSRQYGVALTRRDVLKTGGALGIGAMLGGEGMLNEVLAQDGGTPTGGVYQAWWVWTAPPVGHFNTFVADGISLGIYQGLTELALAHYQWEGSQFSPLLASAWENPDDSSLVVTLRDDVTWSDGAPFTADDVVTTFTILRAQNVPAWNYLAAVEKTDDTHVTFTMSKPSTIVPYFVLRQAIRSHAVYGEWAARIAEVYARTDAATPAAAATPVEGDNPEIAAILEEFNQFKPADSVVTGPYKVDPDSITSAQLTMPKVATSAWANIANFDSLLLFNQTDAASVPTMILSKAIDYSTSGFPPATEQAMIQAGLRIVRPPVYSGPALHINYDKVNALASPKTRQALARAIDRATNGKISLADSGIPSKYMAGVVDPLLEGWLNEEVLARLDPYELNIDEATAAFTELGFTKDGDTWVSPEGERLEYELLVVAEWADWAAAATNLADQLTAFGVKTTVRTVNQQQYAADLPAGNFQLAIAGWSSGIPHPSFGFRASIEGLDTSASGGGRHYAMVQETESVGTVDFTALIEEAAEGLDVETQKEILNTLALAFNELLPTIPLWERLANDPILMDVRVTGWPDDSHPLFKNSVYADNFTMQWILDGTLKGVG